MRSRARGKTLVAVLTDILQPWRIAVLAFSVAVTGLFAAAPDRLRAQANAVVVLATTLETPLLEQSAALLTAEPRLEETVLAGLPTTVARPSGSGTGPTLVVVNGATELGRREPALRRLARGLARAGYVVFIPDLPGLARGELTERTLDATVAAARAAGDRVGLVGVSVGTSLALLAAQDPSLSGRITIVTGTAPYADLTNLVRLATTGYYRDGDLLVPYETDPFLAVAVARSLAGVLPPGPERDAIVMEVNALDADAADPLAAVRALPTSELAPETRAVVQLLASREPRRFDERYAALPADLRTALGRLSPITGASRLTMRVELASAPRDKYIPLAEAEALARAAPDGRLTVTRTLEHAVPEPTLGGLGELLRFNGWVVRSLEAAAA
jgi:pimeloyl-ACP methyl ester carboxylesterase